jgi:hypothetical protein
MAELKEQILKQGQQDTAAFESLSKLAQEALLTEVVAIQVRIADDHLQWHEPLLRTRRKRRKAA